MPQSLNAHTALHVAKVKGTKRRIDPPIIPQPQSVKRHIAGPFAHFDEQDNLRPARGVFWMALGGTALWALFVWTVFAP